MADVEASVSVVAVTAAVGAVVLLFVLLCSFIKKSSTEDNPEEKESVATSNGKKAQQSTKKRERQQPRKLAKKESRVAFSHSWLAGTLKSHSGTVLGLDFSPNGKYLLTCAEDRTVLLWSVKDFNKKEHKNIRANVELDHATKVRFSPDSRAFIVSLFNGNTVRIFKMGKKDDGSPGNIQGAFDFPMKHSAEIINIGIASSGKFIMTCSKDTQVKVWDLKGEILANIDTHQVNNSFGATSPCGRFIASSGFTPDVKVWEVCFDKGGNFREVARAFELKGHSAGVYCFSFSNDSRRMATVSKDGTWKLWDTDIEYQKNQDPYLLKTGKYTHTGPALIALSPDARTVAIATGSDVDIYEAETTDCAESFHDVHSSPITALGFDNNSRYLVTAGDRHIQVFHNVVGYKATVRDLEEKKKKAQGQAHRERLQQQIEEAKAALEQLLQGEQKSQQ